MSESKRTSSANGNQGGKWIRPSTRLAIYFANGFQCAYCERDLHGVDPFEITLDHLVPGHFKGNHASSNLVTACRSCNSARQDKPWRTFIRSRQSYPAAHRIIQRVNMIRKRSLKRYRPMALFVLSLDKQSKKTGIKQVMRKHNLFA